MAAKEYALIVAGGKGTRIKNRLPKQFIELNGKPIVLHTVEAFYHYSKKITVILVLRNTDFGIWDRICKKFKFTKSVIVQQGGATRFQSVRNGLNKIDGEGLVAIHDGVRPLVSKRLIEASFRVAAIDHCAVAAVPLKDSIRMTDKSDFSNGGSVLTQKSTRAVDRARFCLIQTPQTFDVQLIKKAYQIKEKPVLSDDAGVAEMAGHDISLFEGSYENIKITTPEDLIIAEVLLKKKKLTRGQLQK